MQIVERPSPNHDARPEGAAIDMVVLHYTGMKTADAALKRLCDPEARVSAHYTIDREGRIYTHVPEERRAWHAGVSYWAGEKNVNATSIGIELVNPGHEFGYEPFPDEQIGALIDLGCDILARHKIAPARVIGHSDVAPARKDDPGELFPWSDIAEFNLGLWPFARDFGAASVSHRFALLNTSPASGGGKGSRSLFPPPPAGEVSSEACVDTRERTEGGVDDDARQLFIRNLRAYGYGVQPDADVPLEKVIRAFQRHWRPSKIDGMIDEETAFRLSVLLDALS